MLSPARANAGRIPAQCPIRGPTIAEQPSFFTRANSHVPRRKARRASWTTTHRSGPDAVVAAHPFPRRTANPSSSRRPSAPRASATDTPATLATRSSPTAARRGSASSTRPATASSPSRGRAARASAHLSASTPAAAPAPSAPASSTHLGHVRHAHGDPVTQEAVAPGGRHRRDRSGHRADRAQQSRGVVRRAHRARAPRCLHHDRDPTGRRDQPVALQEPALGRQAPGWHLGHERPAGRHHRLQQAGVARRVGPVDAPRQDHDRAAVARDGSPVGGRVDAVRTTGDHADPRPGQAVGEVERDALAVGRRGAGAHEGDRVRQHPAEVALATGPQAHRCLRA